MTAPTPVRARDRRAEVVADDRPVLHLAEDVDDHHVARLERLDDPGVLEADRRATLRLAGLLDGLVEIRPMRQEPGRDRAADGDPARVGLQPAALELARVAVLAEDAPGLLGRHRPQALEQVVGDARPAVREPLERVAGGHLDDGFWRWLDRHGPVSSEGPVPRGGSVSAADRWLAPYAPP